ncbi:MAG: hypothetical protein DCC65_05560 [Planctomycetota bacterium]|nr:MAG: hypothetical protein DCC65_05560 [Planctomycetota bacterium]
MAALLSVWIALGAFVVSLAVVFYPSEDRETVVTLLPYTIALSATLAAAVLWTFRRRPAAEPGVAGRRMQAVAAIVINSITFAVLLVWLHGFVDATLGILLEGGFLCFVYWLYTRLLVPDSTNPDAPL